MEPSGFYALDHGDDEMTPQDLRRRHALGHEILLVDVRQSWEYQLVHLDRAMLLPLHELPSHLDGLDPARLIVVYCHHGIRSFQVMVFLRSVGFPMVKDLQVHHVTDAACGLNRARGHDVQRRARNPTTPGASVSEGTGAGYDL
jgi:rhodanese-related sulfurtransferase